MWSHTVSTTSGASGNSSGTGASPPTCLCCHLVCARGIVSVTSTSDLDLWVLSVAG